MDAHAVLEESIDDGLTDAVGILGSGFDPFSVRTERLAAQTCGTIFSDGQFDANDFAESDVANETRVGVLPPAGFAAVGAGKSLGRTTLSVNANTSGVHACVLCGLVWKPPERHRLDFLGSSMIAGG
jgi:hypothetical protein